MKKSNILWLYLSLMLLMSTFVMPSQAQQKIDTKSFTNTNNLNSSTLLTNNKNYNQTNNKNRNNNNSNNSNNSFDMNNSKDDFTGKITKNDIEESSIEKSFSVNLNNRLKPDTTKLKQVGYDFFQNFQTQGFGRYDGAYQLNIGEKINVYLWGDSIDMISLAGSQLVMPVTNTQVDTKGNIFIPGIGLVRAEGCTISDVEKSIQALAGKKFTNIQTRITVADANSFAVFVYGYVNKPGKIALGNNSTVLEALAAAGGVSKNGSLRNVMYQSATNSQKIDLYDVIFKGKDLNIRLKPNDKIFVNSIGDVVAIKNGVKVPGIYELSDNDNLSATIGFAGGVLPSTNKNNINIKSYDKNKGQRYSKDVSEVDYSKTKLANGDILEFGNLFGDAENFVTLEGNVKHPAIFQYKTGMKLSDVLPNRNELQEETLIHQLVIKRISGHDKQVKSISIALEDFFNGGNDPLLAPHDVITVYKNTSSSFIEVYGCIDKPKQLPYQGNLTLKNVLAGIKFVTSSSEEENVQNVNSKNEKPEEHFINIKNTEQTTKNILPVSMSKNDIIIPAYDIAIEITNETDIDSLNDPEKENKNPKVDEKFNYYTTNEQNLNIRTYYLYDILVKKDSTNDIVINPNDKILFRTLRDNEIIKTVKISGYVNNPGVYSFVEGKKLSDMLGEAGGLQQSANLKGIVLKRESLAINQNAIADTKNEKDVKSIKGQMSKRDNMTSQEFESQKTLLDDIKKESNSDAFDGRIALDIKHNDLKKITESENIEIQDGDEIYIPKISNHVTVMGEVYNETAFIYKRGQKASYYIRLVGGYTPDARRTKIYKISSNGRARRLHIIGNNSIEPGDTIIVPRKMRGYDWLETLSRTMQTIASTFSTLFMATRL